MDDRQRHYKDGADNEILFSKTVKAGKRIYYIDVKRDRKGEFYLSMTESKRLKDVNNNALHPTFEKHKIFLYREDLEKFMVALNDAAEFTKANAPENRRSRKWTETENSLDFAGCEDETGNNFKLDVEF